MRHLLAALLAAGTLAAALAGLSATRTEPALAQTPEAWVLADRWENPAGPAPAGFVREPSGVAAATDGTVYVSDAARGQLHVWRDDAWVGTIGRPGTDLEGLAEPRGVDVIGDRVYVADAGRRRVAVYGTDGTFITAWGGVGQPWGLAAYGDDRLLVADNEGDRLVELDLTGRVRSELGATGAISGQLSGPRGVAAWADGRLAVLDAGNDRVQVWEADGTPTLVYTNPFQLPLVDVGALAPDGLLVAGLRTLYHFDRATGGARAANRADVPGGHAAVSAQRETSGTLGLPVWAAFVHDYVFGLRRFDDDNLREATDWRGLPGPAGEFESPRRVAAATNGLDVLDAWPRVQRLGLDGTPLGQVQVDAPEEVVAHGTGRFLQNGTLIRHVDGVSETWRWDLPTQGSWLVGLAHARASDTLYSIDITRQALWAVSGDGVVSATVPLSTTGYQSFTDLDLLPDGRLLAVNRTASEVEVRDTSGALVDRWPVYGVPLRVAPDPGGGAFVLTREGWVWRLGPTGTVRAWWDAAADAVGRRGAPSDLAVGADGRVYVTDARANEVRAYALDPAGVPGPAPAGDGCTFTRDKWAHPTRLLLGQSTTVTLTVSGACLGAGQGADIVLVVDRSGSMIGRKFEAAKSAALAFVGEIDFNVSRVGLVTFNIDAELPLGLSANPAAVVAAVADIPPPFSGTDIGEAIELGASELITNSRPGIERVLVVMTDGRPEGTVVDADAAAAAAKAAGVQIYSIGFGIDADPELMRRIATSADDYFFAPGATELADIYTEIARRISGGIIARTATITDVVPANMTLVPGSPRPPVVSFANRVLTWELRDVRDDIVLSYRLTPQQIGTWPTNEQAWFDYVDGLDVPGRLRFPVPTVIVEGPVEPIYLPVLARELCRPTMRHADVALVIDTSSSMAGEKLAAAKAAATMFVGRLALPDDHAAIVAFDRTPRLAHGLTGDRVALEAAIAGLDWTPGTVIDAGLSTAIDELTGPRRRPDQKPVIVLLTDGMNNAGPPPVLIAAWRASVAGIVIYAIALGDDADRELMRDVAGDPARFFVALGPADLDRIYGEIASIIPCP